MFLYLIAIETKTDWESNFSNLIEIVATNIWSFYLIFII